MVFHPTLGDRETPWKVGWKGWIGWFGLLSSSGANQLISRKQLISSGRHQFVWWSRGPRSHG